MDKQAFISLVKKYLKGKTSRKEEEFIETWYRGKDASHPMDTMLTEAETAELNQRMLGYIKQRIGAVEAPAERALPMIRRRRIISIAAAAALVFVIAGAYLLYHHAGNSKPEYATLSTERGKMSKLTLEDGTTIWLNAESHLKFPKVFSKVGSRDIYLEGEAYFEVAKYKDRPLIVHAGDLTTTVLGTKFNVKAYPGPHGIEVTLLEGKVMLSAPAAAGNKDDTLYLNPNQKAFLSNNRLKAADPDPAGRDSSNPRQLPVAIAQPTAKSVHILSRQSLVDAEEDAAWIDGKLIFRNASLEDVLNTIGRRFNIRIQSDSSLLDQRVTATIEGTVSSMEALSRVTNQLERVDPKTHRSYDAHPQYRRDGSIYYIE